MLLTRARCVHCRAVEKPDRKVPRSAATLTTCSMSRLVCVTGSAGGIFEKSRCECTPSIVTISHVISWPNANMIKHENKESVNETVLSPSPIIGRNLTLGARREKGAVEKSIK